MVKRDKRLKKSIQSIKEQIEKHFEKLDREISKKEETAARYRVKEIERSLIADLEKRMRLLKDIDEELLEEYRKKLEEHEKKLGEL
ncbi:MAG: hypothetical protein Q8N99_02330 [Nanoarchaeota archaeon]|nr:hypothetical protein [Nanoarchaeota archaeon]